MTEIHSSLPDHRRGTASLKTKIYVFVSPVINLGLLYLLVNIVLGQSRWVSMEVCVLAAFIINPVYFETWRLRLYEKRVKEVCSPQRGSPLKYVLFVPLHIATWVSLLYGYWLVHTEGNLIAGLPLLALCLVVGWLNAKLIIRGLRQIRVL